MHANIASPLELLVVVPVYNEETTIAAVIDQWCAQLDSCSICYSILAFDDGSNDATTTSLQALRNKWGDRLEPVRQVNAGHGPTILRGYHEGIKRGVPWIFQIDSDGQCDPQFFPKFWAARDTHDFIAGRREQREDGAGRVFVSKVLRLVVRLISGYDCPDANVPYRLMRTETVAPLVAKIPDGCFFTNVGLSVLVLRAHLRVALIPITFRARLGGKTTVSYGKMGLHAHTLYRNLKELLRN